MNCAEFRQRVLTDPGSPSAAFVTHRQQCAACAAFAAQEQRFESRLHEALHIDVPAGIAAHIRLRQSFERPRHPARLRWAGAAAASVLVALLAFALRPVALEAAVVAHVVDESEHLRAAQPLPEAAVRATLRDLDLTLRAPLGEVRYAGLCPIRRHTGAHLVLHEAHGPVTVLVLPHETVARRQTFVRDGWHVMLVPFDGGSLALIAARDDAFASIESRLRVSLAHVS